MSKIRTFTGNILCKTMSLLASSIILNEDFFISSTSFSLMSAPTQFMTDAVFVRPQENLAADSADWNSDRTYLVIWSDKLKNV